MSLNYSTKTVHGNRKKIKDKWNQWRNKGESRRFNRVKALVPVCKI
jgi:hypothetical protein